MGRTGWGSSSTSSCRRFTRPMRSTRTDPSLSVGRAMEVREGGREGGREEREYEHEAGRVLLFLHTYIASSFPPFPPSSFRTLCACRWVPRVARQPSTGGRGRAHQPAGKKGKEGEEGRTGGEAGGLCFQFIKLPHFASFIHFPRASASATGSQTRRSSTPTTPRWPLIIATKFKLWTRRRSIICKTQFRPVSISFIGTYVLPSLPPSLPPFFHPQHF